MRYAGNRGRFRTSQSATFFYMMCELRPRFHKIPTERTVYMQYDGNSGLFRTSQSAAFFNRICELRPRYYEIPTESYGI